LDASEKLQDSKSYRAQCPAFPRNVGKDEKNLSVYRHNTSPTQRRNAALSGIENLRDIAVNKITSRRSAFEILRHGPSFPFAIR
jgi:hypothetical protein